MFKLITGPAGSRKTTTLVKNASELLRDGKPVSVLLPTQVLIDDFKQRLLEAEGFTGSLNIEFYTFYTFVKSVLMGKNVNWNELDDPGIVLVLEQFITENRSNYPALFANGITTGFLHSLLDYFSDLANGAVDREQAVQVASRLRNKGREFLREVHQIYSDFFKWTEKRGVTSREQLFLHALEQFREAEGISDSSTFIIDGFYDFNLVQRQLIEAVADQTTSVMMSLLTGNQPIFHYMRETGEWAASLCEQHKGTHDMLESARSFLPEIEQVFQSEMDLGTSAQVRFVEAVTPFLEVQETVRKIKEDILTGQYAPDEICVLYRREEDYYRQLVEASKREGIPMANGHEEPLVANPAVATLLQWYEVLTNDFPREPTLWWLQSDYVQPDSFQNQTDVESLRKWTLEAQIASGKANWIERLCLLRDRYRNEGKNTKSVDQVLQKTRKLWEALPEQRTTSLGNHLQDLMALMTAVNFQEAVLQSTPASTDLLGRDFRAWESLTELLENVAGIAAGFSMGELHTGEFVRIIREILTEQKYSAEAGAPEGVTLTTVEHARGVFWKKVYVIGLNDEVFPVRHRTHPLVKLRDRMQINRLLKNECEVLEHRADLREEQLLFYSALTRATESIQVSTVTGSDTLLPSPFYDELRSQMANEDSDLQTTAEEITPDFLADPPSDKSWLTTDLLQHLRNTTVEQEVKFLNASQFHHLLEVASHRNGPRFTEFDGQITSRDLLEEIRGSLYSDQTALSPSRLELFYVSPFQYFARYLLHLEEPEEVLEELPPDIRGRILHDVMEQFYRDLPDELRPKVTEANLGEGLDFLETTLTDIFSRYEERGLPLPELLWEREKGMLAQYCRNTISFFATTYPWNSADILPDEFEFTFGFDKPESAPAFRLQQNDKTLQFRGRADRLDLNTSTGQFTVVDYKTSRGKRKKDFWNGKALQLQVYAMAARSLIDGYTDPLRLSYYSFKQNKEDTKIDFNRVRQEQLLENTTGLIWAAVSRMEQGKFHPVAGECSKYCPVKHICRCEENRIRRKNRV